MTVANEPNSGGVTMAQYEALYRALDAELVARGLDEQIRLMGGDLIRDNQRIWFQYIAANMSDVLDAYSVHIYWDYWDTPFFMESRLKDVRQIVTEEIPVEARKPTYVMEFGVRGARNFPGKPTLESGYWEDGTDIARTNIAAFQQLWFDLSTVQLGFTGSVKWDAYWGKYNANYNSLYAMIGPASEGWPLFPAYHALRLLLQTTQQGWQVLHARPEDHARHGRLALAGRAVARAGGEVDGDRGDRLVVGDVLGVARRRTRRRRPRRTGCRARSAPSMTRSTSRSAPGISGFSRGAGSSSSSSPRRRRSAAAAGARRRRAPRRPAALLGRAGSSAAAARLGRRLGAGLGRRRSRRRAPRRRARGAAPRPRGLLGRRAALGGAAPARLLLARGRLLRGLLVGGRAVVGHQDSISIGVGFCATCGWSGPA